MTQNTFKSKYCVISDNDIFLSENWIPVRPAMEEIYKDVNIIIDEHGILHFTGYELQYNLSFSKTPIEELEEKPLEKYIKHYKGIKIFGWYLCKPYDYVEGWYQLKETKYKEICKSHFNINFV